MNNNVVSIDFNSFSSDKSLGMGCSFSQRCSLDQLHNESSAGESVFIYTARIDKGCYLRKPIVGLKVRMVKHIFCY